MVKRIPAPKMTKADGLAQVTTKLADAASKGLDPVAFLLDFFTTVDLIEIHGCIVDWETKHGSDVS